MKTSLTDRTIKAAKPAAKMYDLSDAVMPGLILRVMPSGVKSFNLLSRFPGSSNSTRRSLGLYGRVTLEEAREKARKWVEQLQRGIDPAAVIDGERNARLENEARTVLRDVLIPLLIRAGKRDLSLWLRREVDACFADRSEGRPTQS